MGDFGEKKLKQIVGNSFGGKNVGLVCVFVFVCLYFSYLYLCICVCVFVKIYFFMFLSSPRAQRAGPKGPRAESARAVTGT